MQVIAKFSGQEKDTVITIDHYNVEWAVQDFFEQGAISVTTKEEDQKMYKYNPTVTDMRHAYEAIHGELGVNHLIGAMFANLSDETIERMYGQAIAEVKTDLEKRGLA